MNEHASDAEVWVPMVRFGADYSISSHGRVRRETGGKGYRAGRILGAPADKRGYPRVKLRDKTTWRRVDVKVHRAVLAAFVGPCPEGMNVNHIDGNRLNNRLDNLEYVTYAENIRHSFDVLGRTFSAETIVKRIETRTRNGFNKLNPDRVREIRRRLADGATKFELADLFGVTHAAICHVANGKTWSHIS